MNLVYRIIYMNTTKLLASIYDNREVCGLCYVRELLK